MVFVFHNSNYLNRNYLMVLIVIILCFLVIILQDTILSPERYQYMNIHSFRYWILTQTYRGRRIICPKVKDINIITNDYHHEVRVTFGGEMPIDNYIEYIYAIFKVDPNYDIENSEYIYNIQRHIDSKFIIMIHKQNKKGIYRNLYNGSIEIF